MLLRRHYENARSNLFKPLPVFFSERLFLRVRGREDVGFVFDAFAAWTKNRMSTKNQSLPEVLVHDFHGLLFDGANVDDCLPFANACRDFLNDILECADRHANHHVVSSLNGSREVGGLNLKLPAQYD